MRVLPMYFSLLLAVITTATNANSIDCVTLNNELSFIEQLAENGQYRSFSKQTKQLKFDYKATRSFSEYLSFAREKINTENPKAKLKCPIETGVTLALNKLKSKSIITDLIEPFELTVPNSKQAILLIHGLTDSPYLFHDLAAFYHSKGFNVRTLLLPGHGTAPEALLDIEYENWQQATRFAITKVLEDFDQVYLGGFSTGGALILDNLLSTTQNLEKLKGVMLWSPASKAKSSVAWAASVADWIPFLDYAHKGADIDFAKYESFPLNAGAQVHSLMNNLKEKLNNAETVPDIPLLTITSEVDSTIDTSATLNLLTQWHNAQNRKTKQQDTLFYFGKNTLITDLPKTFTRVMPTCVNKAYCANILNVAHTSVTNSPTNSHYGWQGSYRNCETSFGSEHYKTCKTTTDVTLGETTDKNLAQYPSLQRLTFNPSFEQMTKTISTFISETQ